MQILIVEDEPAIADFLERGLAAEGHEVVAAANGAEGGRAALDGRFDLVILDRLLPRRDGLDVLAEIRRVRPELPVIMLTAKAEVSDRVEGLDAGATDYLTKPFAFEELAARVRAHVRRPDDHETRLEAGGLRLDLLSREVERGAASVRLSEREAALLAHLMRRAGQVCSRSELHAAVWGYEHDPGTNIVQVYIGYLRRRLALDGAPAPIETVRSVGYRLVDRG